MLCEKEKTILSLLLHLLLPLLKAPTPSSNPKKQLEKAKYDLPYLKLDIKFDFLTYNGELNAENLDDQIRQFQVYGKIQKLAYDSSKIQLDNLHLGGIALIQWESKTQEDLLTKGKKQSSFSQLVDPFLKFDL